MSGFGGKVALAYLSFTEITDPAEHRAYNEWHMLDHMPEQMPLRGVAHGQRWVSTPRCRAARTASEDPLDPVHYVTCYLMSEPVEQTLREFRDLGAYLHSAGRFHRHRRSHLAGPFRPVRMLAAPRVRISAEAVPYRPHRGVFVSVEEGGEGGALDDHLEWCDVSLLPALLRVPGVAGIWTLTTTAGLREHHRDGTPRRVTLCWLDDDALETSARLVAATDRVRADAPPPDLPGGRVVLAGPLETITPWEWDWFDAPR